MQNVTCPIDGEPCHPKCIRRFIDRPEGGCMLSMLMENSDASLIIGVENEPPRSEPGGQTNGKEDTQ